MDVKQFSIWLVRLEQNPIGHEQGGNRPFFVISGSEYNRNSGTPIGFLLSTSVKKSKNRFSVAASETSHINVSQIRTLDISRFIREMGVLGKKTHDLVMEKFNKEILQINGE